MTDGVSFDLVVCKDVLPYMPSEMLGVAADNLARLSGKYLLVGWRGGDKHFGIPHWRNPTWWLSLSGEACGWTGFKPRDCVWH